MVGPDARWMRKLLNVVAAVGWLAGCSIKAAGSVAQPTALELQLLGAYRKLDDDLVRSGSVRAAGPLSRAARDALAAAAIDARAMQRFNQDDVAELKAAQCVAEGLDARLRRRRCPLAADDPTVARRLDRVVTQENEAREALLAWAAATLALDAGEARIGPEVRGEVRAAYVRLLRQAANKGHVFEVAPGEFQPVP